MPKLSAFDLFELSTRSKVEIQKKLDEKDAELVASAVLECKNYIWDSMENVAKTGTFFVVHHAVMPISSESAAEKFKELIKEEFELHGFYVRFGTVHVDYSETRLSVTVSWSNFKE